MKKFLYILLLSICMQLSVFASHVQYIALTPAQQAQLQEIKEKHALIEANMLINLNKCIQKTIKKKDLQEFLLIFDKLRTNKGVFGSLTAEETKSLLAVLDELLKAENEILDSGLSTTELLKGGAYSLASLASFALMIHCYYKLFTTPHSHMSDIRAILSIFSPFACLPAGCYTGYVGWQTLKQNYTKENISKLQNMEKVLKMFDKIK